ncbi:HNH endonuclease signature motif containing protein [Rhodococcus qingshengii]|uniref:HNH endonuclease signature motif containing protein n=1 Tax=Rhodococcus qingshengii TaxID=334542 RepID=UPI00374CEE06
MTIDIKGNKVLIDRADLKLVSAYKWHIGSTGYAVWRGNQNGKKITVRMHRLITGCPSGLIVDHINHNRLDNRRKNLRICTQTENMRNRSDLGKGYWFHRSNRNWVVEVNGKHIGCFASEAHAARIVALVRAGGVYIKPQRTECKYGHSLADAYKLKDGLHCKPCQSQRSREYYKRKMKGHIYVRKTKQAMDANNDSGTRLT